MTDFSFTTLSTSEWDSKIEAGLRKECEALTGLGNAFNFHSIYVKNGDVFAGGIYLEHHGLILWIDSLWVEPNFRGQGIGKTLLQEALLFARQNKTKEMQLNTYFREAHGFFLTCGFEEVVSIPNWKYGLTCYLMRKSI